MRWSNAASHHQRAEEHRKDGSGGEKDDDDDGAKYGTSPDQRFAVPCPAVDRPFARCIE